MSREMLINVAVTEECRVAVVEDGVLEELYIERVSAESHVGNVYKGKVTNIEPSIQAAFVDFGFKKNGFLHISDLHPRYFGNASAKEKVGHRKSLKERPPIQQCLKKGQDIIVQVTKEGIRSKGPTLTTYLSLPGKYLVFMPWMDKVGVSQKIEDEAERERLKSYLSEFKKPKGAGFIIRTAGEKASKKELQSDLSYLSRLWSSIQKKMKRDTVPQELYTESDLAIRAIRDVFNSKIRKVICDSENTAIKIRDFLSVTQPRLQRRVTYYAGSTPLFHKYKIEQEIKNIQSSKVSLKHGGTLVIEQTEALVAIDVNSGSFRKHADAEKNAFKNNLEAAAEIARQLRLRDLGGLIICDFIDMRDPNHRREVEKAFRTAVKPDRARTKILKISAFGLIEMTRQRMRPSIEMSTFYPCPYCNGRGNIKNIESLGIEILRSLSYELSSELVRKIEITVPMQVADYLLNEKRVEIAEIEESSAKKIVIKADPYCFGENYQFKRFNERGKIVE